VLIGNNGTGKTHLAAATAKALGAGKIFKMLEFGTFIREAYQTNSRASEQGQLDKLIAMPFFALDELEKSKYTPSEMNWLSYVIDERNERYKPTMLLGNLHPKAIHTDGKMCEKCFESVMTADILDRITEVGVICHLTGKSNRADLRGKN
jgi:DNA replication protein DnaC